MKSIFRIGFFVSFAVSVAAADTPFRLSEKLFREVSPTTPLGLGIFSLGFVNSTCTGTLISKKGHVLLARHCVEDAIAWGNDQRQYADKKFQTEAYDFLKIEDRTTDKYFYVYHYNVKNIAARLEIPLGLDDKVVYGKIAAVGPGFMNPRFGRALKGSELLPLHNRLSDQGYSVGGDFAVVEIPALAGLACHPLAKTPVAVGDKMRSASFYCFKEDDRPWPQVRDSSVVYKSDSASVTTPYSTIVPKGNFITDNEAVECNSGSAVFNARNEIAGVLHTVFDWMDGEKLRTYSISLETARILELMPAETRDSILQLNSECR